MAAGERPGQRPGGGSAGQDLDRLQSKPSSPYEQQGGLPVWAAAGGTMGPEVTSNTGIGVQRRDRYPRPFALAQ